MAEARIVVVGAGVAGLTTTLLLARESKYQITVAAKHMPGVMANFKQTPCVAEFSIPDLCVIQDYDIEISEAGTEAAGWDKNTWPELENLAKNHPEAGVHFQGCFAFVRPTRVLLIHSETAIYHRAKDAHSPTGKYLAEKLKPEPWYKSVVPNRGVVFKRAKLEHISEAPKIHHSGYKADLVVNCTGLSALKLGGVRDENMMPIRGQTVLVRNEANVMCSSSGTDDGDEEICYLMQRAAGGGTLLGGSYQRGNWDSQLDPNLAIRIMKRAVELCPALTGGKGIEHLDIVRQGVGLRPHRHGGTRIEKERIGGVWTVHNYGHGGFGYQSSYGCARKAAEIVREALSPRASL
ncbi:MAG: hypothetical protein Q9197_005923 [Variospora fuerteventurae]